MPGPTPKSAATRQRANKKSTATTLFPADNPEIPELPNPDNRVWHEATLEDWNKVWSSPMASEYVDSDIRGLARLATLWDDYYQVGTVTGRRELMAEIRLQEVRFGLSPIDRSRLHWEIAKGEEAERKRIPPAARQRKKGGDPRAGLKAVGS